MRYFKKSKHSTDLIICAIFVTVLILFIWLFRFLPLQDYPDLLFQGFIFSQFIKGQPLPDYQIKDYPAPHLVCTLFIGMFNLVFPPEVSGKIFLSLYVLLFAFSSFYLINSLDPKTKSVLSYIPLILILNYPFFHGNLEYIFSLGVLFLGIGYIIRHRQKLDQINIWIILAFSILIYTSHGFSYLAWLLFISIFLLSNFKKSLLKKFLLGLAPSLIMLLLFGIHYFRNASIITYINLPHLMTVIKNIYHGFHYLCIFHSFYPFLGPADSFIKLIAGLNLGFVLGIFIFCLYWLKGLFKSHETDMSLSITALFFIIFLFIAPLRFKSLHLPGQRSLFPAIWIIFACLAPKFNSRKKPNICRAIKFLILIIFVIEAVFLFGYVGSISQKMEEVYQQLKKAKLGNDFLTVHEDYFDYENYFQRNYPSLPLLPSHSALFRLPYYINIEEHSYAPIFQDGLFLDRGRYNISHHELKRMSSITNMVDYPKHMVILGQTEGNHFIAELLSDRYEIVSVQNYSVVMKRKDK